MLVSGGEGATTVTVPTDPRSLTQEQHARLLEIAERCPVHRTLTSEIDIRSRLA